MSHVKYKSTPLLMKPIYMEMRHNPHDSVGDLYLLNIGGRKRGDAFFPFFAPTPHHTHTHTHTHFLCRVGEFVTGAELLPPCCWWCKKLKPMKGRQGGVGWGWRGGDWGYRTLKYAAGVRGVQGWAQTAPQRQEDQWRVKKEWVTRQW